MRYTARSLFPKRGHMLLAALAALPGLVHANPTTVIDRGDSAALPVAGRIAAARAGRKTMH